ncbi:MAG: carbamoyltransferase HypF, partial [Bacteroidota bacterium]
VWRIGQNLGLNGSVCNATDGVHIYLASSRHQAEQFLQRVLEQAPPRARITNHYLQPSMQVLQPGFHILESTTPSKTDLVLTPDFALCESCRKDIHLGGDPRQGYTFTTCTVCGPRYSIIQELPYDRKNTTMSSFEMCGHCQTEYHNPLDRRYFSQTNSCPKCGIQLTLHRSEQEIITQDQRAIIDQVVEAWEEGKIVAIKGIGGYLLTCAANQAITVQELRKRKRRPEKPFALMVPDTAWLQKHTLASAEEMRLLQSPEAPIVLLTKRDQPSDLVWDDIAPKLQKIGVLLPYAPLFELLLHQYQKAIVATSGNVSQAAIEYEEPAVFQRLGEIADLFLTHDRPIVIPQDDSVVRISPKIKQKIILRRSRGYAPTYFGPALPWPNNTSIGLGAELKSCFTILHQKRIIPSQYLGNLKHLASQEAYLHSRKHLERILDLKPTQLVGDEHPNYQTTIWGEEWSEKTTIPWQQVQHHKAHFAAILGEHQLVHSQESVLGVVWDGTGWGSDQQIWGGEFFLYQNRAMTRYEHLGYFPVLAGDRMAQEPRLSALSILVDQPQANRYLVSKFSALEWRLFGQLITKPNTLQTSSMGRLFDAVATLLGLCDQQSFEGQAAMLLEELAQECIDQFNDPSLLTNYWPPYKDHADLHPKRLLAPIIEDINRGESLRFIAANFHYSLANLIGGIAQKANVKHIACSGGVFQNAVLVDLCHTVLGATYKLYFHRDLSPNDENISFGQLVYTHLLFPGDSQTQNSDSHVLSNTWKDPVYRAKV